MTAHSISTWRTTSKATAVAPVCASAPQTTPTEHVTLPTEIVALAFPALGCGSTGQLHTRVNFTHARVNFTHGAFESLLPAR
jgi:hypothetical protein